MTAQRLVLVRRLVTLLIGALFSQVGLAAEFTVDSTEDAVDSVPGDGVCATATGHCTLRAAIQETNALDGADTINLPEGTYALTRANDSESSDFAGELFVDESGDLDILGQLTISGSGAETTVIDAFPMQSIDNSVNGRVLHVAPGSTLEARNMGIRGGRDWGGGGVYNTGVLTLTDCLVSDNIAVWPLSSDTGGGGIYNTGTLTLSRTNVQRNSSTPTGGGICNKGGVVTMSGGSLVSNRANGTFVSTIHIAGQGGGLINTGGGSTNISGVTIARNQIQLIEGWATVGGRGAGIANSSQMTIANATISDNYDSHDAAGVNEIANGGQMALSNVTIGELGLSNEGTTQLQNTLIAGPCTGTLQSFGHNLIADATGCTLLGDSSGNLLDLDTRLGPLQDNGGSTETRALLPGSPAIDTGNDIYCEATDQRGMSRPLDGNLDGQAICDIGAYEADGSEGAKPWLGAAVLPGSRSVPVNSPATAYATILNSGPQTATACTIAPTTAVSANCFYQTTDPITNAPIGTPNTPADIAPGTGQTFLLGFLPYADILSEVVRFQFDCSNTDPAPMIAGVNTLLLSASTGPIPDIVAANVTINNDGIVNIPGATGTGVFAVATTNVGATADITISADTGSVTLPINVLVCETNPTTGACLGDPAPEVTTTIESNKTPTFGVFVVGNGTVPFDPGNNRIFVYFRDGGLSTRGLTSVAVRTLSE